MHTLNTLAHIGLWFLVIVAFIVGWIAGWYARKRLHA